MKLKGSHTFNPLQQYLPFTVLKLLIISNFDAGADSVATVLTVYGIETVSNAKFIRTLRVATVLTVYGIETHFQTYL